MQVLKNDRFLRALAREPVDVTPIWIMRQAGRYLPEYRATRKQAGDFLSLCKNKELACEVTIQPLERFDLDAAILFSDILTIPDAMGLGLYFETGEGPKFKRPLRNLSAIEKLPIPKADDELGYVMDAVKTIRSELNGRVPLIGFSGSPWTLATYMVEGGATKDYRHVKGMLYGEPQTLHLLLEKLTDTVIDYLNGQILAGAQAVQIFDTWGGVLTTDAYHEFSLAYMKKIVAGLITEHQGRRVPVILFTKNGGQWLESIVSSGCDAVGLDWTIDIGKAKQRIGQQVALQGNLDPAALHGSAQSIREQAEKVLAGFGRGTGHVFNLGHGVDPHIKPEHVKLLVDTVHESSAQYHQKTSS